MVRIPLRRPDISLRRASAQTRLATYLNDHMGGSAAGRELAHRIVGRNRGNEYGTAMEQVAAAIDEDVDTLLDLMRRLDIEPDRIKEAAGWTTEKLGRLKLNGQLLGYSPLSRLIELEGMVLGITGKLLMWQVLERELGDDPRTEGVDFPRLIERAIEQRQTVERLRRQAAEEALT
jgi:hypothetical protein